MCRFAINIIRFLHIQSIQTQSLRVDLFQIDINGFAVVCANLDGQCVILCQNFHAVELSLT
ncbi:TPA: hypothetical protein ACG0LC_003370 [Citrobacter sedlakii]